MLRVGHISYSNCFPIHALLLDRGVPPWLELRPGIPSVLNAELEAGSVDVAPSSSIEYARHAGRYRLLPDVVIGSRGPVESILLETTRAPEALDGEEVALPTASATSVVLLRILLEKRYGVKPRYRWFEQGPGADPVREGAAAALWIGDVALRRETVAAGTLLDLGAAWTEWTGLPFAFAVWQVSAGPEKDDEMRALHGLLLESRAYFEENVEGLAERFASHYGLPAERLARYWRTLAFTLDEPMQRGLLHYYRLAAELGEAPRVDALKWLTP
jgi:chorismate dehydratase